MEEALRKQWMMAEQDHQISEAINREQARLRNFIPKRVADPGDAEDILQRGLYRTGRGYRMMKPVEQVTAWLFRVARNRITDLFRRESRSWLADAPDAVTKMGRRSGWKTCSLTGGRPEAAYARSVLLEELEAALDELPEDQREVFIAHELMGYSFKELAAQTGISVNTLLSRKHYACCNFGSGSKPSTTKFREHKGKDFESIRTRTKT